MCFYFKLGSCRFRKYFRANCEIELELNITLGSRKTGKKEDRVMIKTNENIYKFKTKW